MSEEKTIRYFLGANSAEGFVSLYDRLANPESGDFVWYIKGGPGNGKSTFMRKAAQAAEKKGFQVEYVLCSGDPQSLDGIYIRELKTAYVDATAPHIQEPALPGAAGQYIDLSAFYKKGALPDAGQVALLFRDYKARYARAYDHLKAAALSSPARLPGLCDAVDTEKLEAASAEFADRFLTTEGSGYYQKEIFLSALTGNGVLQCTDTAASLGRIVRIQSSFGLEDPFLRLLKEECRRRSLSVVICREPLRPERMEGLLIPEAELSVLSCTRSERNAFRLDSYIDERFLTSAEAEAKRCRAASGAQMKLAEYSLAEASRLHAELENAYQGAVDFAALNKFTVKQIREITAKVTV